MQRSLFGVAVGVALVLSACTGPGASSSADGLLAAVEARFDGAWAWDIRVDVDEAALQSLGDPAPRATLALLDGFRVGGVVDADRVGLSADIQGVTNIVEFRLLGADGVYLRVDVDQIARLADAEPLDTASVLDGLADLDLGAAIDALVAAALAGDWVGITGLDSIDPSARGTDDLPLPIPSIDPNEIEQVLRDAFGATHDAFLDRWTSVTEESQGSQTTYEITIRLRDLVHATQTVLDDLVGSTFGDLLGAATALPTDVVDLGEVPAEVPLTAVADEGGLAEVRLDLVRVAQAMGESATGTFVITLGLREATGGLTAPSDATVVTGADLEAAVEGFLTDRFNPFADFPTEFPTDFEFPTDLASSPAASG